MNNFEFYVPTKIVFGAGEFKKLGSEAAKFGNTALLVKTVGPLEELGVFTRATQYMNNAGMDVFNLEGVTSNPKLTKIEEGIRICKESGIDVIVAVGGGSAIDTAKAIAFGVFDNGDIWDFFTTKRIPKESLPVIAVSTLAATGAEMSLHCVVTNDRDPDMKNWKKWATHFEISFPKVAIIDAELQISVPKYLTACGMVDTISHVAEGYFDGYPAAETPLQDRLAEGIILTVLENEKVLENPDNIIYRSNLSWAATLAMNGLNDVGRGGMGWNAHVTQHELGAKTDTAHGAGLAVIQTAWLYYFNKKNSAKFVQFAERVFGIKKTTDITDYEVGKAGIDALKEKFKSWGMPVTLKELGIEKEMLPKLAEDITKNPEGNNLNISDLINLLESCYD